MTLKLAKTFSVKQGVGSGDSQILTPELLRITVEIYTEKLIKAVEARMDESMRKLDRIWDGFGLRSQTVSEESTTGAETNGDFLLASEGLAGENGVPDEMLSNLGDTSDESGLEYERRIFQCSEVEFVLGSQGLKNGYESRGLEENGCRELQDKKTEALAQRFLPKNLKVRTEHAFLLKVSRKYMGGYFKDAAERKKERKKEGKKERKKEGERERERKKERKKE